MSTTISCAPSTDTTTRFAFLIALETFARQRPGLEYGNYGNPTAYRAEMREITRTLADARAMLKAASWRAVDLLPAFRAFSGRLTPTVTTKHGTPVVTLDYCTGQYWPTEYRRAVCAVLSQALWTYWASVDENAGHPTENRNARVKATARKVLGRAIAARWF